MRHTEHSPGHGGERRTRVCPRTSWTIPAVVLLLILLSIAPGAEAAPTYSSREIVLDTGPMNAWDQFGVMQPSVISEGGLYKMWYTGTDGSSTGIGLAKSVDGRAWNRAVAGALTILDTNWSGPKLNPSVLPRQAGGYWMWFSRNLSGGAIGRAVSQDGIFWTGASTVLTPGSLGTWDAGGVGEPTVVFHQGKYWMWYVGINGTGRNASIGLATSVDGLTWTKDSGNPVITSTIDGWDEAGLSSPGVAVLDDGTFALWFSGSEGQSLSIGYATSVNGVAWAASGVVIANGTPATADGSMATDPAPSPNGLGSLWYSGYDGATWRILRAVQMVSSTPPLVNPATVSFAFTIGLLAVGMTVLVSSDRFKYALFAIPFIFQFTRDNRRDGFVRGQIYQYIRENPGDYYSSVMYATGATNGNLAHHLHSLVKEGFIKAVRDGRLVRFYPKGVPIPQKHGIRYSSLQVRMLEQISKDPAMTQARLGRILNTSKQTLNYNVWLLAQEGVIAVKKDGRQTYLSPTQEFKNETEGS